MLSDQPKFQKNSVSCTSKKGSWLCAVSISSGDLNVLPAVALNFENLVAKVLPITISSAAMVKEKGRLIGIEIFELDERFSTLDNLAALCALLHFKAWFPHL
jgi:hypothetical protein